jgi:putative membrane protein
MPGLPESKPLAQPVESPARLGADRTSLADFRSRLALDRTTLAWIRTTLTMASFGFGMVGFFRGLRAQTDNPRAELLHENAIRLGVALVITAAIATLGSAWAHWRSLKRLENGQAPSVGFSLSLLLALFTSVLALGGLWFLMT